VIFVIIERLYEAVEARGPVCVGLDPSPELIPQGLLRTAGSLAEAYLKFNRGIVDATLDVVACYKVQIAHYEALGVEGLACYRDTLRYIRDRGALAIGDVKRGDIASTAAMYARAHFEGDFEADFLTLSPYLGFDSLEPFLPYLERRERPVRPHPHLQPQRFRISRPFLLFSSPITDHPSRKIASPPLPPRGGGGGSLGGAFHREVWL